MKYLFTLIAVAVWLSLTSGCVSVKREAPEATTTRTTTVGPVIPAASTTTTTSY